MAVKPIRLHGQLKSSVSGVSLQELTVEVLDQSFKNVQAISSAETDKKGAFSFDLNPHHLKRAFDGQTPEVFFVIKKGKRLVLSTQDQVVARLEKEAVEVSIEIPKRSSIMLASDERVLPKLDIGDLLTLAGVSSSERTAVLTKLKHAGLGDLYSLLTRTTRLTTSRTGLKAEQLARFKTAIKFAATSGSLSLTQKLMDKGFSSLSAIGSVSRDTIQARLGRLNKDESLAVRRLHNKAQSVAGHVANYTAKKNRLASKDGYWYIDKIKDIKEQSCHECVDCDNVFSPKAYLFDLLDLVYRHWEISTETLERIFFQEILKLDCDALQAPILQIEIAIEVLEGYLGASNLPISDSQFSQEFTGAWVTLLSLVGNANKLKQLAFSANNATPIQQLAQLIFLTKADLKAIQRIRELLSGQAPMPELKEISTSFASESDQFTQLLQATYKNILVLYRQALIKKTKETTEELQDKLFIDLKSGACKQTNRLTQFIWSLQSFILAIRTGEIVNVKRTDIKPLDADFDDLAAIPVEEITWKWLKDYKDWAAAMYAFLYPENVIMPFLVNDGVKENFKTIREELFQSFPAEQKKIKEAYLRLLGDAVDLDLVAFAALDPETTVFFDPEDGLLVDIKFFPSEIPSLEADETARTFIRKINQPVALSRWIEIAHAYLTYLGLNNIVENEYELELSLYFPLVAAFILNRSGEFAAAHDWYRQLYDPEKNGNKKFVFDFHGTFNEEFARTEDWYNGVLDPHDIALHREGVFLRYTIITMVRNVLDWADDQFALATAVSLDRARDLYELAKEILAAPDLADKCGRAIYELTIEIVTAIGITPGVDVGAIVEVLEDLNQVRDPSILDGALKEIREVPDPGNIDPIRKIVNDAINKSQAGIKPIEFGRELAARRDRYASFEDAVLQETSSRSGSEPHPIYFSSPATGFFAGPGQEEDFIREVEQPFYLSINFCIPANPLLKALSFYIDLSLLKFQLCLDIAGEPLPASSLSSDSTDDFLAGIAGEVKRNPIAPAANYLFNEPPRYRYSYLMEKARQYTEVAQRLGATLLRAYEKSDSEALQRLQSRHAIELATATISLRNIGVQDAQKGLNIAMLQQDRARAQLSFWQTRIDEGMLSDREQFGLNLMLASAWLNVAAGVIQGIGAIISFFGAGTAGTVGGGAAGSVEPVGGNAAGAVAGGAAGFSLGAAIAAAIPGTAAALGSFAGALSTFGSHALTLAGFERRFEGWQFQRDLSDFDVQIAEAQVGSAQNRVSMANQELTIAELQRTQAAEVLDFFENKFGSQELYEWMISVLSQGYRTTTQIAVSVAKMAQRALEFERQEKIEVVVGDYWSLSGADVPTNGLSDEQKESGILGAERLLTDLTRLDAYKLQTEKRRLQMSKTISLAQLLPGELAHLRATGKVIFNTLMGWFDRDFPGHYLRLIKSVRVTMLALTPPVDGIHATLGNSGESSVVVKENLKYVKKRAFRDFGETIALDSPYNETGLFVFDYNDPMFLPFEGLGVETQWELCLPKASNWFNFDTLVDVLLTIEYTAFHSPEYAETIKTELGTTDINDIPFNVKHQFPDEWYHFKNTYDESANERALSIELPTQFLPSHYAPGSAVSMLHLTVILQGDFGGLTSAQRNELLTALEVSHEYQDGTQLKTQVISSGSNPPSGTEAFRFKQVEADESRYAIFSTRDESNADIHLPANINPLGTLNFSIDNGTFANGLSFADLIDDVIVALTVEGGVSWS